MSVHDQNRRLTAPDIRARKGGDPLVCLPRRRGLTDQQVATLPRKAKRYNYADPEMRGHYLRLSPDRATPISYAAVARDPSGMQHWATLGTADAMGIDQARELAREAIKRIKGGKPTSLPGKPTVRDVAEQWLQRHVDKKGLRSAKDVRLGSKRTPHWGRSAALAATLPVSSKIAVSFFTSLTPL